MTDTFIYDKKINDLISRSANIKSAAEFMENAHKGQLRKGTKIPYITHTLEAALIASEITDDEDVIIAALLHDTVEDAGISVEELSEKFGGRVAEIVAVESEDKKTSHGENRPWKERKEKTIEEISKCDDEGILIVCLADKLSNMKAIDKDYTVLADKLWSRFNMTDPSMQGWYYRSLSNALGRKLGSYPAWQDLDRLVNKVFSKYPD